MGIKSREHEALDDDRIAALTSSVVAGLKDESSGGGVRGGDVR